MNKVPKRADKAIGLLDDLVEQLHYFYGTNEREFKKSVLKSAIEIENTLKDLAVNKKDTFKRIAQKYESYYKKKAEITTTEEEITDSVKTRYKELK